MVVEGIARGEEGNIPRLGLLLRQSDRADLRVGEHDLREQTVVDAAHLGGMRNVMRRDFALLNRDVDDFVRSGAVASRVNVRCARLHLRVGDDARAFGCYAGFLQVKPGRVRRATEREEYFLGCHANRFAIMLEGDSFQVAFTPRIHQLRPGKYRHAIAAEHSLQFRRSVRVEVAQNMFAALDQCYFGVETREELGKLHSHRPAAKYNQ